MSGLAIILRDSTAGVEPAKCLQPLAPKRRDNYDWGRAELGAEVVPER